MSDRIDIGIITTPTPEDGRPERRDAAENRELILHTATALFAEHGVLNVNMAEIAKAAGVGKGTLYRRFANKGQLCLSLLDDELMGFQNDMLDMLRSLTASGVGPRDQIKRLLQENAGFIHTNLDLMVEIDRANVEGLAQEDINTPHFWIDLTLRGLFARAIEIGEIRPDVDLNYMICALLAPLDGRILRSNFRSRGFTIDDVGLGLSQLVDGLAP